MERASDRLGRLFRFVHLDHQLGDVGQQSRVILFLQRQPAEILALHLPDQHHHRRRVVIRGVQRHHRVGQPRAARHDAAAGAVAQPSVGHRHVASTALMPAHHHADGVPLQHRAGEADIALAGDAKDLVYVMRFQALRQQAGDGAGHCHDISSGIGRLASARGAADQRKGKIGAAGKDDFVLAASLHRQHVRIGATEAGSGRAVVAPGGLRNPFAVARAVSISRCNRPGWSSPRASRRHA